MHTSPERRLKDGVACSLDQAVMTEAVALVTCAFIFTWHLLFVKIIYVHSLYLYTEYTGVVTREQRKYTFA